MPILKINNLTYAFDSGSPIFQKLSIHVDEGEFVSVIGPSGSGKSTLFKLVTGLIAPQEGGIEIQGTVPGTGKVGYMPQKDLLLPWRTVLDNVLLPVEVSKTRNQNSISEAKEWLSRFGLAEYEKAYPHELSGGMRQRVAFLRTIMTGRDLLLLDEPFGALDSITKRNMHKWLLSLWEKLQKTVLFITHDLEEALLLSDRIYMLKGTGVTEMKVNLPRPRTPDQIFESDFIELRKALERLIRDES